MSTERDMQVQITAPRKAELCPVERDGSPLAAGEIAGRTLVSLISAGTELNSAFLSTGSFPRCPGYAAVFEVDAAGEGVREVAPGDRVFCSGPHRSRHRCGRAAVVPVPAGVAPEAAVFTRLLGVSWATLTTTTAKPPGRVLVTGLGPVGNLAAQLFQACGYDVTAIEPVAARREMARSVGIERVLPAVPVDDPEFAGTVDLAVECSGHEQAVLDAARVVRKRGEVVLVGVPWRRRSDVPAFDLLHEVFFHYVVVRSGWEWEVPKRPTDFRIGSQALHYAAGVAWLAAGRISVDGLYRTVPPHRCQEAYDELAAGECDRLAIVFDWTGAGEASS